VNVPFRKKEFVFRNDQFEVASYVLRVLASEGGDVQPILDAEHCGTLNEFLENGFGIDALRLKRASLRAMAEVSRIALLRDGRPNARLGDWQLLVYCLVSCRSLRDAIERMSDFFRTLDGRLGFVTLHLDEGVAELRFDCLHLSRSALSLVLDLIGMASMHGLLSWLIADTIPVIEICLPYSESFRCICDQRILPYPIHLGGAVTALRFPAKLLNHPVMRTGADCDAHDFDFFPEARGEGLPRSVADQARRAIFLELRDKWTLLSLDALSERLGRNRETLRRQLKDAGTNYNSIKDSCRCELGMHLLRHTRLKIEEVAGRLDFCDSDAFRRSFHEWTGITPSAYRRGGSAIWEA